MKLRKNNMTNESKNEEYIDNKRKEETWIGFTNKWRKRIYNFWKKKRKLKKILDWVKCKKTE